MRLSTLKISDIEKVYAKPKAVTARYSVRINMICWLNMPAKGATSK